MRLMPLPLRHGLYVHHRVDFSRIDAVGFDLDHTLALYDDDAVNRLAANETVALLADRAGYPRSWVDAVGPEDIPATRTMALDLRGGAVVKLSGDDGVSLARRDHRWLGAPERARRFPARNGARDAFWPLHSPFDAPTLWFFEHLAPLCSAAARQPPLSQLALDIRSMLNVSHTEGELKIHLTRAIDRFVFPAGDVRALLARLRDQARRLFVVTNSRREYATAVLDVVVGPDWRDLFAVVVVDARKPSFFEARADTVVDRHRNDGSARVVEGGNAFAVERLLGATAGRVLYVGDNLHADIQPARAHGWLTAHIVPELAQGPLASPWGALLEHNGAPTRFARGILGHAHLVCDRVDALLEAPSAGPVEPTADLRAALGARDTP
jgi:HAD superfamily 5'-nucleotidase-like hydrolase